MFHVLPRFHYRRSAWKDQGSRLSTRTSLVWLFVNKHVFVHATCEKNDLLIDVLSLSLFVLQRVLYHHLRWSCLAYLAAWGVWKLVTCYNIMKPTLYMDIALEGLPCLLCSLVTEPVVGERKGPTRWSQSPWEKDPKTFGGSLTWKSWYGL